MTTRALPMFPLGAVLFPYGVMPLHVFEPRYRALTADVLAGDGEFGVVLIERGREVGGGDVRFEVGTVARVVQAAPLADGRWALVAVGTRRLRVVRWLGEEPYPRAEVELLDEPAPPPDAAARRDAVARLLAGVAARRAELGEPGPGLDVRLDDDAGRAAFEASAHAGLGPLDAQSLLEAPDAGRRLELLEALLVDEARVLEARLSGS